MLKQFTIDFRELAKETSNRFDVDFIDFNKNEKHERYLFSDFFKIESSTKKDRLSLLDSIEDDFLYAEIGNVTKQGEVNPEKLNFLSRNELVEDYFKKIEKGDIQKVNENNILLAKVRPNLRKYVLIDKEYKNYFYTTAFINLKPEKLNKIFYYSFRTIFYNDLMAISRQGKGYPTLKEDDLFYLKFDKRIIKKLEEKERSIISQIEPIENKIKEMKNKIAPAQEVINKVFAREFGFDEKLHNEFGKGMTASTQIAENKTLRVFDIELNDFSRSNILRFSTRFHNMPTKKLTDILDRVGALQVRDIIIENIHRGASPKYNPDGEIPVVKTGHLKNGSVEISEEEFIDREFYNSSARSQIRKGDVLVASTGKGSLGKIDILEDDQNLSADAHVSIIRIDNKKYDSLFFTYFFRSILGYFQIERDFTGATNQIELYAEEIENFKIPDISLNKQQKIVAEIKAELDRQEEMKKKIEKERKKIDEIIENAIK